MAELEPESVELFLRTLSAAERAYAYAYSEHLSVADPYPLFRDFGINGNRAATIRSRLNREWNARVWRR